MPEASNDAASSKRCLQWMYVLSLGDGVAQWKLVQSGREIRRVSRRNSQCNRQTQVVFINQPPNSPQYAQMGRRHGGGPLVERHGKCHKVQPPADCSPKVAQACSSCSDEDERARHGIEWWFAQRRQQKWAQMSEQAVEAVGLQHEHKGAWLGSKTTTSEAENAAGVYGVAEICRRWPGMVRTLRRVSKATAIVPKVCEVASSGMWKQRIETEITASMQLGQDCCEWQVVTTIILFPAT